MSERRKTKNDIITRLVDREGGYVDNKHDSGGETRWGITEKRARLHGYIGKMHELPYEFAVAIYERDEWLWVRGDDLLKIDPELCEKIFDFSVNAGAHRPSIYLQRILNVLNRREKLYEDVVADGVIGPQTIQALLLYANNRDLKVLRDAFVCFQGSFYLWLAENREKDEEFVYGWLRTRLSF